MLHWNCEINWNYDKFKLWDKVEIMTLKVEIDTKSKLWDKVEIMTLKVEIDTKSKLWDKVEIMT